MKKFLFALCALCSVVACNDEEPIPVTSAVLISLQARFPDAQHVTWHSSGGYLVADFYLVEEGARQECAAWFTPTGEWQMTERELSYADLPLTVQAAYEASEYATWGVEDVVKIERPSSVEYLIAADGFYLGVESDAYLYYTEGGSLIRSVIDPNEEYWGYVLEPMC